jgi:hypothetical protein
MSLRDAGQASLAFFYFDFRDEEKKQDIRNFLTSLLVQLSAYSSRCCKIISRIYSTHGRGTTQPSNDTLMNCLREMLSLAAQQPTYLIIDALDECPDSSGMPTPREDVLNLLEVLAHLGLPNLRICVTSRPEIDIKNVLGPLASSAVSLHDESGQKRDIYDYVRNSVYSDKKMRRWRNDEKELVIWELSNKVDGMYGDPAIPSDSLLILYYVGSDGYSVNLRCCGIVSRQVFGRPSTSYPNRFFFFFF